MSNLFKVIVTDNKDGLTIDKEYTNLTIREAIEVSKDYSENQGLNCFKLIQVINLKDNKIYFEFYQDTDFTEDIEEDDLIQIEGVK